MVNPQPHRVGAYRTDTTMIPQDPQSAGPRARYSTGRPTAGPPASMGAAGRVPRPTQRTLGLGPTQWTALIFLGVVFFVGIALATGVLVGRLLRPSIPATAWVDRVPNAIPLERGARPIDASSSQAPGAGSSRTGRPVLLPKSLATGEMAPAFTLETLQGQVLALADLRDRPVLINFWATWCAWCKYELPALQAVQEKYADQGLVVVGVNVEEPRSLVEAYVKRYQLSFPVVLDVQGRTTDAYHVRALPMTYFIDANGKITHIQRGAMREDELERYVLSLLSR